MVFSWNVSSPSQNDQYYFDRMDKALDIHNNYDKVLLFLTAIWLPDGPTLGHYRGDRLTHPMFITAF